MSGTRVVVCCGSGGVGKTTTSAALALSLALEGQRVAVLTIDPARRLADSLGVGPIGNTPQRVPLERIDPAAPGSLDAMMLDMKATFDSVVVRFAPTPEVRDNILNNRYYRFASTRLAGSHEYMAMERLFELVEEGRYDVVVLDTPPTRHALEFLSAPDRMSGLMDDGVLHWLSLPRDSRGFKALERGSDVVINVLTRLLGSNTIGEIAEFFHTFRDLWGGFRQRSLLVHELLRSEATSFLLVTSPAPSSRREAQEFLSVLRERGMPFGGFIVNRVALPPTSPGPIPLSAFPPAPAGISEDRWQEVVLGVAGAPARQARLAEAEHHYLAGLRQDAGESPLHLVPELTRDIHDLESLAALRPHLEAVVQRLPG